MQAVPKYLSTTVAFFIVAQSLRNGRIPILIVEFRVRQKLICTLSLGQTFKSPLGTEFRLQITNFRLFFQLFMAIHGLTNYEFFFFIQYLLHSDPDYSSNFVYNSTGQPEVLHSQQKETVLLFQGKKYWICQIYFGILLITNQY